MTKHTELDYVFIKPELSIQECKTILCKRGETYTEDEIKEIRNLILNLVEIDLKHYFNSQAEDEEVKVINLRNEERENRNAA